MKILLGLLLNLSWNSWSALLTLNSLSTGTPVGKVLTLKGSTGHMGTLDCQPGPLQQACSSSYNLLPGSMIDLCPLMLLPALHQAQWEWESRVTTHHQVTCRMYQCATSLGQCHTHPDICKAHAILPSPPQAQTRAPTRAKSNTLPVCKGKVERQQERLICSVLSWTSF